MDAQGIQTSQVAVRQSGMSYKFQRLREKIREAVENGELTGKLPGERTLARRFHVNAKTLSKALTDLAAEGVLDRSIGRGTYVKGSAPAAAAVGTRWLVIAGKDGDYTPILDALRTACQEMDTISCTDNVRPSFLNQFSAVIDLCCTTPDTMLRNLLVRNMPVVAVNKESFSFSVNTVLADTTLGVTRLCRDLILAGHRRLGAVEPRGERGVVERLRASAARYGSEVVIESVEPADVAALAGEGITGLVCSSPHAASIARDTLEARGFRIPDQISLTAVGCGPSPVCSGYYVDPRQVADSVAGLLKDFPLRPVSLWLSPNWVDKGTLAPVTLAVSLDQLISQAESHAVR